MILVGRAGRDLQGSTGLRLEFGPPRLPDTDRMHPEGYAVATVESGGVRYLVVLGADDRGVLYGVGAALREIIFHQDCLDVPDLHLAEKPAFCLRGTEASSTGPRSGAIQLGKCRPQTPQEQVEACEDLILLGANVMSGMGELVRSYGLMTYAGSPFNALPGDFPPEWAATPSNSLHIKVNSYFGKRFVCPSVPEARRALLDHYERMFSGDFDYDYFATSSGDVAGCACPRCTPWGGTFIRTLHQVSDILHKHHPRTKMIGTAQNLTNEGDQAIIDYLNEHNTGWFHALRYAPGGNEMSKYNRGPVNPRWFEYPGFGILGNYLKHLHHQLPTKTEIVLFSDITHWIRSQYGVEKPDVALAAIYNRRAWNARPKHYDAVASEVLHYAIGDMYYSEGIHDDFNKWFWHRKLWDPHLSEEEITREYCRYWFGPEAEANMTRAIFLMEETLEKPVVGNAGIREAVDHLRSARNRIPGNLMERDFRWRVMMQKALLDRYIQLWLERGEKLKTRAGQLIEEAAVSEDPREMLEKSIEILGQDQEVGEMEGILLEVRDLGEESNEIIGYREPAYFNLRDFDITEIGWWLARIIEAVESGEADRMRNAARMVLRYEDPGEGGFYERVGWPSDPIHLVEHENIIGYFPFTGPARLHQYGMGYSWGREDSRMIFVYPRVDPDDQYVLRICTGFHCSDIRDFFAEKVMQGLEVNGSPVGDDFPLPLGDFDYHEFEIPNGLTREGHLEIVLKAHSTEFPMVGLCGIWLMRRDRMPWTIHP